MRCLTLRQSSTHRVQQGPPLRGRKLRHLATLLFDETRRQSPREGRVHCKWHDNHENTMIMSWWCGDNDNDCAVGCDCKGGWQRRQMQMLGLVCSHVTRHNEIPPARFSQMHVLDSGITKLNVVAIGSNAEKKSHLDVPSTIIHHHPPSSTIIHQLQYQNWIRKQYREVKHSIFNFPWFVSLSYPKQHLKRSSRRTDSIRLIEQVGEKPQPHVAPKYQNEVIGRQLGTR